MSKKHKNKIRKGERVICPACFDESPQDRVEMIVKKTVSKTTSHPLIRKNGKIEIDYGFILDVEGKNQEFTLICPKCKTEETFLSPELLIADLEPLIEYIAQLGAFKDDMFVAPVYNIQKKKEKKQQQKEITLPKIVRISENDSIYTN